MGRRATSGYRKIGCCTAFISSFFPLSGWDGFCQERHQAQQSTDLNVKTGYVTSKDGVRLYYARLAMA
jgi:hypothetical protein